MSSAADPKPVVTGYPVSAAGYPYAAPPPPPAVHYYPAPAPPPPPYRSNTLLIRRLIAGAIAVFLAAAVVTLAIWLILRPRLPDFSLTSVHFSPPSRYDLSLSVYNPNSKISIQYDHVTAAVLYGHDAFSEVSLPSFHLGKRNSSVLHTQLVADDVAKAIADDQNRGDESAGFHVRLLALVRFQAGIWRTGRHVMRVYCDDVSMGFKNKTGDSMVGPPKRCQVNL
ncbi:NDR1/HIN1-like protein 10 [Dioscorea cayenensis subsp. rotundata]|uniref:NDR1/HIN1-like protein 10 n=1 Tax=Dioscorea cayennensis subsp. rotundata TaxID=55577 RepID=A0AB40BA35_DIOCR|nr:NDR1/HIN1-like protein 10 [Dioscorea cayenensis subsp. rotundata]